MTKQILDTIFYENERHLPLSISGSGLPHPRQFGINPFMISTACWRGFYCQYTVREDRLWLTHLVVQHDGKYPPIGVVEAIYEEDRFLEDDEIDPEFLLGRSVGTIIGSPDKSEIGRRELHYDGGIYPDLYVPALLTGGVLLGIGDVKTPYIQHDLNGLIGSEQVLELLFQNGVLVKKIDHSDAVDMKRKELLASVIPEFRTPEYERFEADVKAWIRSTLTYDYKFVDIGWLWEIYPNT